MKAISLFTASLGQNYNPARRRTIRSAATRTGSHLSSREVKVLVRQFARNVRQLRRILIKEGLFQKMLGLEILMLNEADCESVRDELSEVYEMMESSNVNSLVLTTFSIKSTLLENIQSLVNSKSSFRFWRMLPVWLKNIDKVIYGYDIIGSVGMYVYSSFQIDNKFIQKSNIRSAPLRPLSHQKVLQHQNLQMLRQPQQSNQCPVKYRQNHLPLR